MAKFTFQLEGVLRQRKNAEQQRQRELAAIAAIVAAHEAELRKVDGEVRASEQDLRDNRLTGKLDLPFLASHRRFSFAMQRKAVNIAQQIATVRKQLDEARRNLVDAAKARKAIEKLRENQFNNWRADMARRETAQLDEIAMQMAFEPIASPTDEPAGVA
jgi:flagellar export protein FliJ